MRLRTSFSVALVVVLSGCPRAVRPEPATPAAAPASKATAPASWVERSNAHTLFVLETLAAIGPESASSMGMEPYDDQITDLRPGFRERFRQVRSSVTTELQRRLAAEQDPKVRQDLQILLAAQQRSQRGDDLDEKYFVPSYSPARLVFGATRALLDAQNAPSRREKALIRLKKYTGVEPGFTPVAELMKADVLAQLKDPSRLYPPRAELERDLNDSPFLVEGTAKLFEEYGMKNAAAPALEQLRAQLADHDAFVRTQLLPKARSDFRVPAEVYAHWLADRGIDATPDALIRVARAAFTELQAQLQQVAAQVAEARGLESADYRAVIRELKKEQLAGDAILALYQQRLGELEAIIRREKLVSLPDRPARIRLASEAETAQSPAPHMRPPRMLGNTGEQGEFVLPLNVPSQSKETGKLDDFTFAAAAWTLTAHEARPGHELQFARLVEDGVSTARALFAFNSTNVEGWALYAEKLAYPFMPPEGQLISLQHRLLRAARAFSDPELQQGKTTPEAVKALLMHDVVLSEAMATQEVERYTFRMPGQAPSYFHGFVRLSALRDEVEQAQGARFDAQRFHDFILGQGLLPPDLLRAAVMQELVGR